MRDYRKCDGSGDPTSNGSPIVSKVCLKMSLENVVKDIPLISDNSWTYGDLMVSMIAFSRLCLATKFYHVGVCKLMCLYSLDCRKWSHVY